MLTVGIRMIRGSKAGTQFRLFGLMAVVLGAGDSFHLVPRALALCTTGLESYTVPLGLGKWITSVTMTVFYVLLYYVWRKRYQIKGQKNVTAAVYALSAVRIVLCMMPQNQWLTNHTPLAWGILRNVPFALLGLLIIVLFYRSAKQNNDKAFRWMWLTIVLSFGFYIPVVLWADVNPLIGMLMIPKTCAYVWTVLIGYNAMKAETASRTEPAPPPLLNTKGRTRPSKKTGAVSSPERALQLRSFVFAISFAVRQLFYKPCQGGYIGLVGELLLIQPAAVIVHGSQHLRVLDRPSQLVGQLLRVVVLVQKAVHALGHKSRRAGVLRYDGGLAEDQTLGDKGRHGIIAGSAHHAIALLHQGFHLRRSSRLR